MVVIVGTLYNAGYTGSEVEVFGRLNSVSVSGYIYLLLALPSVIFKSSLNVRNAQWSWFNDYVATFPDLTSCI